ncbi:hypothetical protein Vdis_2085 [Vulcanisaeta distributa DSM 14429]|uniref:Uncharacterized protein n=2 Tax=Vulcanisaeta distributa TaxID=164451 RepID=E1QPG6_VULDI|nr:hypothetical protein Vdis_2085 [Vulcanisaeta distributa DSM 14429]
MNAMLMSKSAINDHGITIRLLRQRLLTEMDIDDTTRELLAYIIYNEPITLYRISKNTRFAISTVYKKAKRMLQYGLIRPLNISDTNSERGIYVSTVKGLLVCLALNCVDDESIIFSKLCQKWHLRSYCCQRIMKIISVLPALMSIDSGIMRMIDDPKTVMMMILEHRDQLKSLVRYDLLNDVINMAMHYLISRLIIDGGIITKSSILIGNDKFVISIGLDGNAYVYMCTLCGKSCIGMQFSVNYHDCVLLHEIKKLRNNSSILE